MKQYWKEIDKSFQFKSDKLRLSFDVSNPVYGKRLCVYLLNGKEEILLYDGMETKYDFWKYHNPKIEEDVISILADKLKKQEYKKKKLAEREEKKRLDEQKRLSNLVNNY
jgi:hypothetical protein